MFQMSGRMSIYADTTDEQLEIIVEDNGTYTKHIIGISDNVTYGGRLIFMDIKLLLIIILFIGMNFFLCMSIYRRNKYKKMKKELEDLKNRLVPIQTIATRTSRPDVITLQKDYVIPRYELDLAEEKDDLINMIQKRMINEMVDQIHPYVNYIYDDDPIRQVQTIRARLRVLK